MKQIDKFWNWFLANEEAIIHAIRFGINANEVFLHFDRHFTGISKRIGFMITLSNDDEEKHTIVFSALGYSKLFPKIRALEQQAPKLLYFTPQAFIKPLQDKTAIIEGKDNGYNFGDYYIRISQLYLSMDQYDLASKRLRITVYVPEYDALRMYDDNIDSHLICIVLDIVGEVAFRKHIRTFGIATLPDSPKGLLKLIELQDCIDQLYKIDSRRKTRLI